MSFAARRIGVVALTLVLVGIAGCDAFTSPEQRLARARTEIDSGQWGLAASELRKVVQKDEHNGAAWLLLAQLALNVGDSNGASSALDHAAAAGKSGPELDRLQARNYLASGRAQALIDALDQHKLPGLTEPDRTIQLARAYNTLRQPERADAVLAPLLQRQPELTDAILAHVDSLALEGKYDAALALVDRAVKNAPHSADAHLSDGRLLGHAGKFEAAESAYDLALHNLPAAAPLLDRERALIGLIEARLTQNKVDLAAQSEAALAKLAPTAATTQLLAARIKIARGDMLGGISILQGIVAHQPGFVPALMSLGSAQLQQGNLEQAREAFQQAVQQAPDNVQARELLARVRLRLHQPDQAVSALTPALTDEATDPQLMGLLGLAESQGGDAGAVVEALERAQKAHPQDNAVRLNLAQAYLRAGRAQQALALLEGAPEPKDTGSESIRRDALLVVAIRAVRGSAAATSAVEKLLSTHPRDGHMLDFAAAYYSAQGQLQRALALLKQALELNAQDVPTLVSLARIQLQSGDSAAAESSLRKALAADSSSAPVRIQLADLLLQRRAFDDAQRMLAPVSGPHAAPSVRFALARVAFARGDSSQGDSILEQAVAEQPRNAALSEQAGNLLLQVGQYDAALTHFTKATELDPSAAPYWLDVGRAQLALNHAAAARESLEKAAQLDPQWLPPVRGLVLIDVSAKNYESARSRASQLLARQPNSADAMALVGDVEWAAGQHAKAVAEYQQAQQRHATAQVAVKLFQARVSDGQAGPEQPLVHWLAEQPGDRTVRAVLADYYLNKHDLRRASTELRTILEQAPDDVVALNNLAWAYQEQHDPRAEATAEHAYRLAPNVPNVNDTLGWILARSGKLDRALSLLAQAVKLGGKDPNVQYHYAYVLAQQGKRAEAHKILSSLLDGKQDFESRRDAERLLAQTQT